MGVAHDVDAVAETLARRVHAPDRVVERAVAGADPHLDRLEIAAREEALQLRRDPIGRRPAAGRIRRHAFVPAAAEQAPHRHAERFAEDVPKRHVDAADRGYRQAAPAEHREGVAAREREVGARCRCT